MLVLLLIAATSAGVFDRTPGARIEHETFRGEIAVYQGSGLYRNDPAAVAREAVTWDHVDLFLTVPLFAVVILLSRRGSLRARLFLAGLLAYLFYRYLMFATMSALNEMFLVYVAVAALAPVAFFLNLSSLDVSRLPERVSPSFPRALFIATAFLQGGVLLILWPARVVAILKAGKFPPELAGMSTLETQAIDLALVVPLSISAGILLWRKSPWGYLLAAITLAFGFMMCIVIPAWILVPWIQMRRVNWVEAVPFLAISLLGLCLNVAFYRGVSEVSEGKRA